MLVKIVTIAGALASTTYGALRHTGFLRVVGGEPLQTIPGTKYIGRGFDGAAALKVGLHSSALKVVLEKAGTDTEGGILYNIRGLNFEPVQGIKFTHLVMTGDFDVTAGLKTKARANGRQIINGTAEWPVFPLLSQQSAVFQLNLDTLKITARPVLESVGYKRPFCYVVAGPGRPAVAHLVVSDGGPACNDHHKGVGSWKVRVEFAPISA